MGILNEFERRLEGVIEGDFGKAFRTSLQPVEMAKRILKEMEANKTVGVRQGRQGLVAKGLSSRGVTSSGMSRIRVAHIYKTLHGA